MTAAPRIGAVNLFATVIAGQLLCSLLLDHYGLVGCTERHIGLGRVVGLACLVAGVTLVRLF